jgi:hypothetical protein
MADTGFGLGERKFGQTYAIRILLVMLMVLPVGLVWSLADASQNPEQVLLWACVVAGVIVAALWIVIGRTSLTLSDAGVRKESVFGTQEILWPQITETRYLVTPIRVWAHFGLIGALIGSLSKTQNANLTLRVISIDGREIKITSNFQDAKEAIGIVLGKISPAMVSEARGKIEHGGTVQFGPLALSKTDLAWKAGSSSLPLSEIQSAEIVGSKLRVKRKGKMMAAYSARSDKVPNVLVFLEVLDWAAPQLRSGQIDPLARVRL